jgi:RNA polymerase sigma-70 factor (ECF subfamily)
MSEGSSASICPAALLAARVVVPGPPHWADADRMMSGALATRLYPIEAPRPGPIQGGYALCMPAPGPTNEVHATSADTFAAFYRENYQAALNLVRCRAERADHEAIVADAFLVAWQHQQASGGLSRAWFYGVVRNKIGDFYRSARRREVPTEFVETHQSAADQSSRSDDQLDVQRVLRSLPAADSEPLILAYWCGLSAAEAARALGIREGNFRGPVLPRRR